MGDGKENISAAISVTTSLWASAWPWQISVGPPEWRGNLARLWIEGPGWAYHNWPVGLMDKASAPGAGDSRFESWAGHYDAVFEEKVVWMIANWLTFRGTPPCSARVGERRRGPPWPARACLIFWGPTLGTADARAIPAHSRFLVDLPPARTFDYWGALAMAN